MAHLVLGYVIVHIGTLTAMKPWTASSLIPVNWDSLTGNSTEAFEDNHNSQIQIET